MDIALPDFTDVVPYLDHPLALVGYAIFLLFALLSAVIKIAGKTKDSPTRLFLFHISLIASVVVLIVVVGSFTVLAMELLQERDETATKFASNAKLDYKKIRAAVPLGDTKIAATQIDRSIAVLQRWRAQEKAPLTHEINRAIQELQNGNADLATQLLLNRLQMLRAHRNANQIPPAEMKELVATAQAIGGLAFLTNTKAAIGAYRLLIKLTPEDWLSWYQLSILELRVGNYNKAVTAAQKVRDIGQENKEEAVVARSQGLMSVIARQRSELREAETLGKKAVNSLRGTNDRKALAVELGNLGIVKRLLGKYGESEKLHKEALQIEESLDSYLGRAREYGNLGALLRVRGSNFQEQAVAYISLSLEYNEKAGSKIGVAIRLNQLGEFAMQRKDWDSARSRFNEALKIERELEDRYGEAMVISNLGRLHKFLAQFSEHPEKKRELYEEASGFYQDALDIYVSLHNRVGESIVLARLARL